MDGYKIGPLLKAHLESRTPGDESALRVKLTIEDPPCYPAWGNTLPDVGQRQQAASAVLLTVGWRHGELLASTAAAYYKRYGELPPTPLVSRSAIFVSLPPEAVADFPALEGVTEIELAQAWRPNEF